MDVFQIAPDSLQPLNINTLDPNPELDGILKEFGIIDKSKSKKIPLRPKGKPVYFRDFIKKMTSILMVPTLKL